MFRKIRILILSVILVIVAMSTWLTQMRNTSWEETLWIAIYPINGDQSRTTRDYISKLSVNEFTDIERFLQDEASYYKLPLKQPAKIVMAPEINSLPPKPPESGNVLSIMLWSLKLRYWAYKNNPYNGPPVHVRLYVIYHDPKLHKRLAHSLGLEKGHLGVVNAFASRGYRAKNNVIITHEFLHTLGASDKYDLASSVPHFPAGYADPLKKPLHPQKMAEIMGGRIPLTSTRSVIPPGLHKVVVGNKTASEINWPVNKSLP